MTTTSPGARRRHVVLMLLIALVTGLGLTSLAPATGARPGAGEPARPTSAKQVPGKPIVGTVVDVTTGKPLKGQKVRLRTYTRSGPGRVLDTEVTNQTGRFSLTGIKGFYFYVELLATRGYQHGYAGVAPRYFVARWQKGSPFGTGSRLGKVRAWPSTISGTVVDVPGDGVAGVTVSAYRPVKPDALATAITDADGDFRLTGIDFERDGYLRVDGSAVGLESGYLACDYEVVASFEDACAAPLGLLLARIKLEPAA